MGRFSFLLDSGICSKCGEPFDRYLEINNDQSATINFRSYCPDIRNKQKKLITKGEAIDLLNQLESHHLHQMKVHENQAKRVAKSINFVSH